MFCYAGLPTDVEHFLACGADRVLLKPLNIDAFKDAMRVMKIFTKRAEMEGESPRWDREEEDEWVDGTSQDGREESKARDVINFRCSL